MWSQVGLRKHHYKASDGIPAELFQILKDDAFKVLHAICQQIWKTRQWPQDWKRSIFIPIPKKGNAQKCLNYHTIVLISRVSKITWGRTPKSQWSVYCILSVYGCTQYTSKFGKLSSGHRTGKGQFSFQSLRKATKNAQIIAQLHSFHTLVK